jgi:hypothetical protein
MESETANFVVARLDRQGQLPPTYLRKITVAGRNELQQLAFGPRDTAHVFTRHAEAEDIARRLRQRVSQAAYEFIAQKAPAVANALPTG